MKSEVPAGDEAVSVNACEEAIQVLVVDLWCGLGVKVPLFQKLDEFKHVAFGQVVWERRREELDAVQHWSERSGVEADDWKA